MLNNFRADLHMHSTWSDGTDSPRELLTKVKGAGISYFAITDHDEYRGSRQLLLQLKEIPDKVRPVFITGAEFSCRDEKGKYHILAYAYDTQSAAIRSLMASVHKVRIEKAANRMAFLKDKYGFSFSESEYAALMRHHNPGKPATPGRSPKPFRIIWTIITDPNGASAPKRRSKPFSRQAGSPSLRTVRSATGNRTWDRKRWKSAFCA